MLHWFLSLLIAASEVDLAASLALHSVYFRVFSRNAVTNFSAPASSDTGIHVPCHSTRICFWRPTIFWPVIFRIPHWLSGAITSMLIAWDALEHAIALGEIVAAVIFSWSGLSPSTSRDIGRELCSRAYGNWKSRFYNGIPSILVHFRKPWKGYSWYSATGTDIAGAERLCPRFLVAKFSSCGGGKKRKRWGP